VFGRNEIVGQKFFQSAGGKFYVTSIFYTVQGEGPLSGIPSVFVRLAKCNLACGFCDTYFDGGDWLTVDEINDRIEGVVRDFFYGALPLWAADRNFAVILTGGEPMLQDINRLCEYFENLYQFVQIESNGTIYKDLPLSTTLVVSPKCSEKTHKYLKPNDKVLDRADCLKFVISADLTSPYHEVPDWAHEWKEKYPFKDIYISPMNMYNREPQASKLLRSNKNDISIEERSAIDEVISFWEPGLLDLTANEANHAYAAEYCMRHGFRVNLQMHLYLGKA
jgi:7-carboxy-7-deazaguanine synthase